MICRIPSKQEALMKRQIYPALVTVFPVSSIPMRASDLDVYV